MLAEPHQPDRARPRQPIGEHPVRDRRRARRLAGRAAVQRAAALGGAAGASVRADSDPARVTSAHRIRLASGVLWERLTTVSEPGVEFLYVIYEVGGASSPADAFQRHAGHEWGYVLSGHARGHDRLPTEHVLEPGDAISLDSTTPHRLANIGDVAGARHLVRHRPRRRPAAHRSGAADLGRGLRRRACACVLRWGAPIYEANRPSWPILAPRRTSRSRCAPIRRDPRGYVRPDASEARSKDAVSGR